MFLKPFIPPAGAPPKFETYQHDQTNFLLQEILKELRKITRPMIVVNPSEPEP